MTRLEKAWNVLKAILCIVFYPYSAWQWYRESKVISEESDGMYEDGWVNLYFAISGIITLTMAGLMTLLDIRSPIFNLHAAAPGLILYVVIGVMWLCTKVWQFFAGAFDRELEKDLAKSPD